MVVNEPKRDVQALDALSRMTPPGVAAAVLWELSSLRLSLLHLLRWLIALLKQVLP